MDQPVWPEFIVGTKLSSYFYQLPDDVITDVACEPYAVDPSGYEYYGWIIYTK